MYSIVAGLVCAVMCQHFYRQRRETAADWEFFSGPTWFSRWAAWQSYGVFGVLAVIFLVGGLVSLTR